MSNVVISSFSSSPTTATEDAKHTAELHARSRGLRAGHFSAIADFWLLVGIWWAPLQIRAIWQHPSVNHIFTLLSLLTFAVLPLNFSFGLYSRLRLPTGMLLRKSAAGVLIILASEAVAVWISPGLWSPAIAIVILVFLPASLLIRAILAKCFCWQRARPHNVQNVVIVGHDARFCGVLADKVEMYEDRCNRIVAFFGIAENTSTLAKDSARSFESNDGLIEYLTHNPADVVLFAAAPEELPDVVRTIASISEMGLTLGVLPQFYSANLIEEIDHVTVSVGFAGLSIIRIQSVHQGASYLFFKRLFDIIGAASALLLLSPVFLLITVLVKITSRGPIFYPWKVLGKNRRPFVGYKFRTMVPDADRIKKQLMQFNEMTGPVFKMRNDPRITPVGRWLRRFSLDELPQLYSVLKGDMSFVGPRPPSKSESDRFEFWQHRKLSVKPGITCLWQVSGRSEISDFSDWARLDLQYISSASFALDMKILLRTLPVVLIGHGAY